jgi:hypothetical protein
MKNLRGQFYRDVAQSWQQRVDPQATQDSSSRTSVARHDRPGVEVIGPVLATRITARTRQRRLLADVAERQRLI